MRITVLTLVAAIAGLVYLAVDPTPVAKALHRHNHDRQYGPPGAKVYAEWQKGVDAGDPYYMLQMGLYHRLWGPEIEGVTRDREYGEELMIRSMEAGFGQAGTMWYFFVDKTEAGLRQAARSGSPSAIEILAYVSAGDHCIQGSLPENAMTEFLAQYEEVMDPERQDAFYPGEVTRAQRSEFVPAYSEIRQNVLQGIPNHFDEVCSGEMSGLFPEE